MVQDGELHCMDLEGFWMDVGQPRDYLTGIGLYLKSLEKRGSAHTAYAQSQVPYLQPFKVLIQMFLENDQFQRC